MLIDYGGIRLGAGLVGHLVRRLFRLGSEKLGETLKHVDGDGGVEVCGLWFIEDEWVDEVMMVWYDGRLGRWLNKR